MGCISRRSKGKAATHTLARLEIKNMIKQIRISVTYNDESTVDEIFLNPIDAMNFIDHLWEDSIREDSKADELPNL